MKFEFTLEQIVAAKAAIESGNTQPVIDMLDVKLTIGQATKLYADELDMLEEVKMQVEEMLKVAQLHDAAKPIAETLGLIEVQ